MRSVERRFAEFQKASPGHSSFVVFGRTIRGQQFSHRSVAFYFRRLVSKDDYALRDRNRLLRHLVQITNLPVDSTFQGKNAPKRKDGLVPNPLSLYA